MIAVYDAGYYVVQVDPSNEDLENSTDERPLHAPQLGPIGGENLGKPKSITLAVSTRPTLRPEEVIQSSPKDACFREATKISFQISQQSFREYDSSGNVLVDLPNGGVLAITRGIRGFG